VPLVLRGGKKKGLLLERCAEGTRVSGRNRGRGKKECPVCPREEEKTSITTTGARNTALGGKKMVTWQQEGKKEGVTSLNNHGRKKTFFSLMGHGEPRKKSF